GIDARVDRRDSALTAPRPDLLRLDAAERRDLTIGEPELLAPPQQLVGQLGRLGDRALGLDQLPELHEEPGVDLRRLVELLDREPEPERVDQAPHPVRERRADELA